MSDIQIVVRRKPKLKVYVRKTPSTVTHPKDGQIETRLKFAEIASKAKGMKGLDPETGLPRAAALVMKEMKGYRAKNRYVKKPKWLKDMEVLVEVLRRAVAEEIVK